MFNHTTTVSNIDFFIKGAVFKNFDHQGNLNQQLDTEYVEHDEQKQISTFQQPWLKQFKQGATNAEIKSHLGTVDDNNGPINFSENVIISSYKNSIAHYFLSTQFIAYNRIDNSIDTDADVELTDIKGNITTATGLSGNISDKTLELKTNVKGIFYGN